MLKTELNEKTDLVIKETKLALQTVYDTLNHGQQQKILKEKAVKDLFDRYGIEY